MQKNVLSQQKKDEKMSWGILLMFLHVLPSTSKSQMDSAEQDLNSCHLCKTEQKPGVKKNSFLSSV